MKDKRSAGPKSYLHQMNSILNSFNTKCSKYLTQDLRDASDPSADLNPSVHPSLIRAERDCLIKSATKGKNIRILNVL